MGHSKSPLKTSQPRLNNWRFLIRTWTNSPAIFHSRHQGAAAQAALFQLPQRLASRKNEPFHSPDKSKHSSERAFYHEAQAGNDYRTAAERPARRL